MSSDEIGLTLVVQSPREEDQYLYMKLSSATDVGTLKVLIEAQCNVPANAQLLVFKGAALSDERLTLAEVGVHDGDPVLVRKKDMGFGTGPAPTSASASASSGAAQSGSGGSASGAVTGSASASGGQQPELKLDMPVFGPNAPIPQMPAWLNMDPDALFHVLRADPEQLQRIQYGNPPLAQAVMQGSSQAVRAVIEQQRAVFQQKVFEEQRRRMALMADPLNPDAQRVIEQEINQEQINQNYEMAHEHMPESFGRVVMLYVPMEVEGVRVNAFIDSGAQTTIMSEQLARKCGILRLMDRRFHGVAKGVGTAKILGRIHMAKLKFGDTFLPCSFTIMDDPDMEFLFGLDMLRRHQAVIDLSQNSLVMRGQSVQFLQEKDIPHLRAQTYQDMEMQRQRELQQAQQQGSGGGTEDVRMRSASDADRAPNLQSASSASQGQSQPQQPQQRQGGQFPEQDIATLMRSMNCTRAQAVQALAAVGGNVDMAASVLFQMGSGLGF